MASVKRIVATAVVTSDALLGEGLSHILHDGTHRVIAIAASFSALSLPRDKLPALVIMVLPSHVAEWDGILAQVRHAACIARVVILTEACDMAYCQQALRAGAVGYLSRSINADALIKSLDLIVAGEVVISPSLVPHLFGSDGPPATLDDPSLVPVAAPASTDGNAHPLSSRESEILQCIAQGDSNKHISRRFAITEATVKAHVKSILRKINARNRTQAAAWALRHQAPPPTALPRPETHRHARLKIVASNKSHAGGSDVPDAAIHLLEFVPA